MGLLHLAAFLAQSARRVGEASHPGPRDAYFALGCINPTGLNGKYAVASGLESGIYGVSETHLTERGIQSFRKRSFTVRSPFKLHHGATVRPRSGSSFSGEYTGVGFLSTFPARAAPCAWPEGLHETGRLRVVNFFIQPLWLLCGVAYGFPTCPHKTAFLLESLTQRIVNEGCGPRAICGDFNLEPQQVPLATYWRTKGFVEIQDLQQRLTGQPPLPTCKGKTRKDFCWISPELQSLFAEVVVDETVFADHAVLSARLKAPSSSVPRIAWRMPTPLTRDMLPAGPLPCRARAPLPRLADDPDAFCKGVFAQYEQSVSDFLVSTGRQPLAPRYRGRTCANDVVLKQTATPHPSLQYGQRFKQLRRLPLLFRWTGGQHSSLGA